MRFKKGPNYQKIGATLAAELILITLAILLPLYPVVYGQAEGDWSLPVNLSTKMQQAWFPDITTDSQGGVHLVFLGSDFNSLKDTPLWGKYDNLYYQYISPDGIPAKDGPINVAVSPFGVVLRTSITADSPRGMLDLVVRSSQSVFYQSVPIAKAGAAAAWSELRNLDDSQNSYYSDIVVDKRDTIHAAWTQVVGDSIDKFHSAVVYRQSTDQGRTWSFPKIVAEPKYGATRVVLKLDQDDGLHLSWDDGYDNQTGKFEAAFGSYSRSTDGGKTWSTPISFGSEKEPVAQTVLTTFGNSGVMLAWRVLNEQRIDYMVSNDRGLTWSKPAPVPGITALKFSSQHSFDRYYLAGDGKGRVHLAAVGLTNSKKELVDTDTDQALYHSVWEKGDWSQPEQIAHVPGYAEYPRIAIGPDRLHIVWFARDKPVDENSKSVWYTSRPYDTGLKAQALGSYTPPAASPATTTTSISPSTPSPAGPALPPLEDSPSRPWIDEGYTILIISIIPVIGLALVMLVKVSILRHRKRS